MSLSQVDPGLGFRVDPQMGYSLHSLKGKGEYIGSRVDPQMGYGLNSLKGSIIGGIKGGTRSLDYSSNGRRLCEPKGRLCRV